jgi:hypothetical protein
MKLCTLCERLFPCNLAGTRLAIGGLRSPSGTQLSRYPCGTKYSSLMGRISRIIAESIRQRSVVFLVRTAEVWILPERIVPRELRRIIAGGEVATEVEHEGPGKQ